MTEREQAEKSLLWLVYVGGDKLVESLSVVMGGDVCAVAEIGGYRLHETETHFIDVVFMLGHWRICESRKLPYGLYDGFWNYASLQDAVLQARAWRDASGCGQGSAPMEWIWCWHTREMDYARWSACGAGLQAG